MKKREIEFDVMRICALFAVILVHVCGMKTYDLPVADSNWQILTFLQSFVTWQVPVYIMISGRFFLDPERNVTFHKMLKSILRLVIIFLVWDMLYQIYYILSGAYSSLNWKGILSQIVEGPYHLWFLQMLVCLYVITPILRKITDNKKIMEYFIFLFLIFEFLNNYGVELPYVGTTIDVILRKINFGFPLGYTGYYILGYYLYRYKISGKWEIFLYVLGVVLAFFAGIATTVRSVSEGYNNNWYSHYLLPNIVIESAAIYTFFLKHIKLIEFSDKIMNIIKKISDYSFGIYLIHAFVLMFVQMLGITPTLITPFIMVPFITIIVFFISYICIYVLRKVPVIGKKIT